MRDACRGGRRTRGGGRRTSRRMLARRDGNVSAVISASLDLGPVGRGDLTV